MSMINTWNKVQSTFSVKVEPNLTLNNDVEMNALVPLGSHSSLNIFTALPEASGLNTWELTASKIHTYNYFLPWFSRTLHSSFSM